ncbi:MAG: ABC transporter ATP-binding protein [Erysipelothrix sp.]|nr:ABC transporter ATP-binding protein [Erysipelothrix sp.]
MHKYRYGDKKALVLLSGFLLMSAAIGGISIYALSFITDYAVAGNVTKLVEISKILLIVIIFELIVNMTGSYLKSVYMKNSMQNLRNGYVERLFILDIKNLSQTDEDKYLSHLSNDMDRYEERFYLKLVELIEVATQIFVSMYLLATINNTLLFLAIALLIFFVLISKKTSKPVAKKEEIKSASLQKYTNYISETLQGFFVIKQNNLEKTRIKKFKNLAQQVQKDNYEVDKKATQIDALNSFIQTLIIFTLVFAGLYFAKKAGMSLGTTLLAGTAFSQSIWPMQRITPYISQMAGISVVLKEFEKHLDEKPSMASQEIKTIETIRFKEASLGYKDEIILKNINIEINENEKVLIVGSSGAGKSTVLKTLRRQLPLHGGSILINNLDLNTITANSYYRQLSVVDQIGFIFNGSLKDNITLYKDDNYTNLNEILKSVGLFDLNLDYKLKNNGSNISGGQRARLLLARALYLDTSLIICDEIFASLDKDVGQAIERQILLINKTIINVSHIIFDENIKLYDKIYLVENNQVRLVDNFQEIKASGLFLK